MRIWRHPVSAGEHLSHAHVPCKKNSTRVGFCQFLHSTFNSCVQCKRQKQNPSKPLHHVPNSPSIYLLYLPHLLPPWASQTGSWAGQAVLMLRRHWTCSRPVNWSKQRQEKSLRHVCSTPSSCCCVASDGSAGLGAATLPHHLPHQP